jgi:hypothetical protein
MKDINDAVIVDVCSPFPYVTPAGWAGRDFFGD